jgi:hypothetical protein
LPGTHRRRCTPIPQNIQTVVALEISSSPRPRRRIHNGIHRSRRIALLDRSTKTAMEEALAAAAATAAAAAATAARDV